MSRIVRVGEQGAERGNEQEKVPRNGNMGLEGWDAGTGAAWWLAAEAWGWGPTAQLTRFTHSGLEKRSKGLNAEKKEPRKSNSKGRETSHSNKARSKETKSIAGANKQSAGRNKEQP